MFAAVILVAYLWQLCRRYYSQKQGLSINVGDEWDNPAAMNNRRNQEKFIPKNPPTPRTKAMMEADPDFNPNNINHRVMTLEALDRTSSTLL